MKVFHIVTQMEAGGAQGAAIRNADFMRRRGIDSRVVFLYRKRPVYDGEPGVVVIAERRPRTILELLKLLHGLVLFLRDQKPDSIITYTHYANVVGGILGRLSGIKTIVSSHRNPTHTYPRWCRRLDKVIGSLGVYDRAIAVSETVRDSFENYPSSYRKNLVLVRNGIDLDCYSEQHSVASEEKKTFLFVSAGRLHPQKNHQVIVDAMASVSGACLEVIGDGELKEELKGQIDREGLQDVVQLRGEIPPASVRRYLRGADAFLFPSNYEAFGFAVVEAMAVGLPVICSDIPAMREVVGNAGILLPTDDVELWAQWMNKLVVDEDLRAELSARSRERAKMFSLDKMAEGYMAAVGLS